MTEAGPHGSSGKTHDVLDRYLLASDAGYGFIIQLKDLFCKNRNGKAVLRCPENANMIRPFFIEDIEAQYLAAVTSTGRLLLYPVADLPELTRGKGNKIINPKKNNTEKLDL